MKITIDIPEHELREAVENIPPDFFSRPGESPIRTIALAMKQAVENYDKSKPLQSAVKSVTKVDDFDDAEGTEVLRINFSSGGPLVLMSHFAVDKLRSEDGVVMRDILTESLKATLDKICTH